MFPGPALILMPGGSLIQWLDHLQARGPGWQGLCSPVACIWLLGIPGPARGCARLDLTVTGSGMFVSKGCFAAV